MIRVIYISTGRLLVYGNRVRQFVLRRKTTAKKNVSTRTIFTQNAVRTILSIGNPTLKECKNLRAQRNVC